LPAAEAAFRFGFTVWRAALAFAATGALRRFERLVFMRPGVDLGLAMRSPETLVKKRRET